MRKNKVLTPSFHLYTTLFILVIFIIYFCVQLLLVTLVFALQFYISQTESVRCTKVKLSSCISNKTREKIYNSPMYIERFSNHLLHVRSKMVNPCNIYVLFTYSLLFFNSRGLIFIIIIYNTECYSHFYDINLQINQKKWGDYYRKS